MFDLADHIGDLKRKNKSEHAGSCPWCGGEDRFVVWPSNGDTGRFWCRQCGKKGDGIDYLREVDGHSFREACEVAGCEWKVQNDQSVMGTPATPSHFEQAPHPAERNGKSVTGNCDANTAGRHTFDPNPSRKRSTPPPDDWQKRAWKLVTVCEGLLWEDTAVGRSARNYLHGRGLSDKTIRALSLGVNPQTQYDDPALWGMDSENDLWVPRGIVIPWFHAGHLWGVNIRRPGGDLGDGARKYQRIRGTQNALYNADLIDGRPVAIVEGEFDAIAIHQSTDEVAAVATGSTSWARAPRWRALLRAAPIVLVCFDDESAGEDAARYWTDSLPHATRWRPHMHDAAEMLEQGCNIARWIEEGLDHAAGLQ
jgi:hypothetical protein